MSKIKVGVVEDEVIIADNLCSLLHQLGYDVLEPVETYAEALVMIEQEKPDLLLLDIQIKGKKDGIAVAAKLQEMGNPPFIFLTANADAETVQRAKQTGPTAYLLKPFTKDDLYAAIEICLHNASAQKARENGTLAGRRGPTDALFIKDGTTFHKVKFADVLYLESEHVYVQVHSPDKKYLVRATMQQYLSNFDEALFVRIHRSYVINLSHIDSVTPEHVLIKGRKLPLGKTYQEELFARLKIK